MAGKAIKSKKMKLLLSVAIPMLVVVITIIAVSTTFAWFANVSVPTVQTIRLTTQKAFILQFTASDEDSSRNINYKGQEAIKAVNGEGFLATEYNGARKGYSGSRLEQFMLESPYYFITTIALDTENTEIKMNMVLDSVKITNKSDTVLNNFDDIAGVSPAADIPYAFTWYFKEHVEVGGEEVKNFKEVVPGDEESRVMRDYKPTSGEVWYTPYGKLTFNENGYVSSVNDVAIGNDYSALTTGLQDVNLIANNRSFDFYIVFAPEKLFWAQFFMADRDLSVQDIYNENEYSKIYGKTNASQMMFYSNMSYFSATFKFGAMINVTEIKTQKEGQA